MKKSRILAGLVSAVLTCSISTLSPASAVTELLEGNPSEIYADYTELPKELGQIDGSEVYDYITMRYLKVGDNKNVTEIQLSEYPDSIEFLADKDIKIENLGIMQTCLLERISDADNGFVLTKGSIQSDGRISYAVFLKEDSGNSIYGKMSDKDIVYVYNLFSAYGASDFKYTIGCYNVGASYAPYMTAYSDSYIKEGAIEKIQNYINENDIAAHIVLYNAGDTDFLGNIVYENMMYVVPDTELSDIEHYQLAQDIFINTGMRADFVSPTFGTSKIPKYNYIPGDANYDGKVDISDAVLILQYLSNPEKYPISAQGLLNADIVGNDGVTALDALQIQMIEAGSIS